MILSRSVKQYWKTRQLTIYHLASLPLYLPEHLSTQLIFHPVATVASVWLLCATISSNRGFCPTVASSQSRLGQEPECFQPLVWHPGPTLPASHNAALIIPPSRHPDERGLSPRLPGKHTATSFCPAVAPGQPGRQEPGRPQLPARHPGRTPPASRHTDITVTPSRRPDEQGRGGRGGVTSPQGARGRVVSSTGPGKPPRIWPGATTGLSMDFRVGLRWHFLLWLSDFKTKTSFGFLIKKSGAIFNFFRKVENWARTTENDVFGNFSENLMVLQ